MDEVCDIKKKKIKKIKLLDSIIFIVLTLSVIIKLIFKRISNFIFLTILLFISSSKVIKDKIRKV